VNAGNIRQVAIQYNSHIKVKVEFTLEQATKAQRGVKVYSSTLSLTSALDGVGGQRHAPI
jgi:hypothetical protein